MTAALDSAPSAVLDRASLILGAFEGHARLNLAQIVRRTGLPRSSVHRMLERLVALRWLCRDGHDYALGMRLVELGSLAVHQDRLHRAALPFMDQLHRMTGLVVHLAILDGPEVVYLEKVGDRLGRAVPTRVGGRRAAHCTAVGKVLLAYSDDSIPLDTELDQETKYSIGSTSRLRAELVKIRTHRVAYEREESLPRFGCVAAPIGENNTAVAALSVCGPVDRMTFDRRMAASVSMAALGIWRNVAHGPESVTPTLQQRSVLGAGSRAASTIYA